jgi:alpha-mannosidase
MEVVAAGAAFGASAFLRNLWTGFDLLVAVGTSAGYISGSQSAADFARLVGHLRAGTITMSMQGLVPLYGAMPTEAVLRDLYYAGRLERRYGLDFNIVQSMENMTLPGGVASLWAGAGARYSWRGVCGCATRTAGGVRQREIYNFVGPDGRGVVMKWNTSNGNESLGGYAEARHPDDAVMHMTGDPGFRARWPYTVMGAFGFGHDADCSDVVVFFNPGLLAARCQQDASGTGATESQHRSSGVAVHALASRLSGAAPLVSASLSERAPSSANVAA